MNLFSLSRLRHIFSKAPAQLTRRAQLVRPSLEGLGEGTGTSLRPSFRPMLESLEERTVPSLIAGQFLQPTVSVLSSALTFSATTNQIVTLTANVGLIGGILNGGTVNFTVVSTLGGTVLGTVNNVPVINGVAQTPFTVPAGTPPGSFTISAVFSGSGGSNGSSGSSTLTIGPPALTDCDDPAADAFLGTAARFAVLAGSTVTNTGPTFIVGDVGVSPGTAVTGFPPGSIAVGKPGSGGTIHSADAIAIQARNDVITAFGNLAGEPTTSNLTGQDLGGLTLTPGVYRFNSSAQLTGTLILDAGGNPNARFDFQIGSTLTTASGSVVRLINGGRADDVFWQVGSSATLGTTTEFEGNILALTSITLNTRASIACGRALAINGAVTMDTNFIDPPAHSMPTGAAPDSGAFQSVKLGFAISSGDNQVNKNLFDLDGKPQGNWTVAAPGQFTSLSSASFGPGGDIMLLGLGLDNQIYGARFKSDGNLVFGWFLVAPGQFKSVIASSVGTPGSGSFPMAFGVGTDGQVYAARFSGEGTLQNGFYLVAPGQFQSLSASQYGAGNPELFGIGLNKQVYATRFDTNGDFVNGWFLVAPGQFTFTTVTTRDNGGEALFAIGADQHIYGAFLDANGALAWGWFPTTSATALTTFTSATAVNLGAGTVALYALGTDRQIYNGAFDASTGLQTINYNSPAPGLFSSLSAGSLSAGANLPERGEVLGVGAFDGKIYGELFSPADAYLGGFFATGGGAFRAVV